MTLFPCIPLNTFTLASNAASIFAGVDVTDTTNHPNSSRSNKLTSKFTSYVKPNASRTVVNRLGGEEGKGRGGGEERGEEGVRRVGKG